MRSKNDARLHTGRRHSDSRARAAGRRTTLDGSEAQTALHSTFGEAALEAASKFWDEIEAAEAGDESMDGLHSRNEG